MFPIDLSKIVIAPDSFKGCLSAPQVCEAIAAGIHHISKETEIHCIPMADGGEGSAAIISAAKHGYEVTAATLDPLLRPITATYNFFDEYGKKHAIIDVAAASGLALLLPHERDARLTSSYGTGLLIKDAISRGADTITLCLGGSATIDFGIGILQALGVIFFDEYGLFCKSPLRGIDLASISKIDSTPLLERLQQIPLHLICDVDTTALPTTPGGRDGCLEVFGPQKGISFDESAPFRQGIEHFIRLLQPFTGLDAGRIPYGGAAGGIALSLHLLAKGKIYPGSKFIADICNLDDALPGATLAITGEGASDAQTLMGKVASEVLNRASLSSVRTALLSGKINDGAALETAGFSPIICINDGFDSTVDPTRPETARERLYHAARSLIGSLTQKHIS